MTYCTVAQARDAGATGDDAAVAAAIATATDLIDAYTGNIWEARSLSIVARVETAGEVFLPFQVQAVTSVTPVGSTTAIPASGYLVLSSSTLGQVDAVVLGGLGVADPLIAGAEPWAGGWRGFVNRHVGATGQVTVAGTFGTVPTPVQIVDACAALAAWRTQEGTLVTTPSSSLAVDDEGDSMAIATQTVVAADTGTLARTTGLPAVDASLAPLRRDAVMIGS